MAWKKRTWINPRLICSTINRRPDASLTRLINLDRHFTRVVGRCVQNFVHLKTQIWTWFLGNPCNSHLVSDSVQAPRSTIFAFWCNYVTSWIWPNMSRKAASKKILSVLFSILLESGQYQWHNFAHELTLLLPATRLQWVLMVRAINNFLETAHRSDCEPRFRNAILVSVPTFEGRPHPLIKISLSLPSRDIIADSIEAVCSRSFQCRSSIPT